MKKIIQKENPLLREISLKVPEKDITSVKIAKILNEMKVALDSQEDGVAIAAPQIGYNVRIFIIAARFLPKRKNIQATEVVTELEKEHLIFINPVITKLSRDKREMEEGCLSVRYLYGKVLRSQKATVVAYDENGNKFTKGVSGLVSQIFQHEIDHLDGILFIDTARSIEEVIPEQVSSNRTVQTHELTNATNKKIH